MRLAFLTCVGLVVCLGCSSSSKGKPTPSGAPSPAGKKVIISPSLALVGKVVSVNTNLRFAVLDFPPGIMPTVGQQLSVYRGEQKVGEVKVSGPQRDTNIAADITAGQAQVGDQ